MQLSFINLLIQRLKSEQPAFYKKLQYIAIVVLLFVGIIWGANWFNLFSASVHDKINTACYAVGTFIIGVFFTSMTGTKDPNLISHDTKDAVIKDNGTTKQ